ncbi:MULTISPECIES: hypothetical protein [Trichocoleus]|uniref:Uncharacterized protein n=1 Tax=Trichocoleus desertorum GB2-A4 TaxID=2933944 RepID=A0ABV0JFN2_9CYAN|nr:hypothetical protein [Trichocoleus sp. FACHB-262]
MTHPASNITRRSSHVTCHAGPERPSAFYARYRLPLPHPLRSQNLVLADNDTEFPLGLNWTHSLDEPRGMKRRDQNTAIPPLDFSVFEEVLYVSYKHCRKRTMACFL